MEQISVRETEQYGVSALPVHQSSSAYSTDRAVRLRLT